MLAAKCFKPSFLLCLKAQYVAVAPPAAGKVEKGTDLFFIATEPDFRVVNVKKINLSPFPFPTLTKILLIQNLSA